MLTGYLSDLVTLLVAAVLVVPLASRLGLGALPGFLLAGALVGPYGFQLVTRAQEIHHFAEIGVVFLLFIIGIEISPTRLWTMRRLVFGLGSLQILCTGVVLSALAHYLVGLSVALSLLVGSALALSSTAFVVQLLADQGQLHNHQGRAALAVLLMQDVTVVPLLAIIPFLGNPDLASHGNAVVAVVEALALIVLVVGIGRYLLQPVLHRLAGTGNREIFTAVAVLIVLGTALLTEQVGLSMALGAFMAGMLISDSAFKHQIVAEVQPFRGLFLGLFFMSMGMEIDFGLLLADPLRTLVLVGGLLLVKLLLLYPLARLFGLARRHALAVALLLAQGGEFALVLFSEGLDSGLLPESLYRTLLLVVLLSLMVTPLLAAWGKKLATSSTQKVTADPPALTQAPVVIAGFGRVGKRIGQILRHAGVPFVAVEADAGKVKAAVADHQPVFYGDVRNPTVLANAGAADAKVMIVTVNDSQAAQNVVESLHHAHPGMHIYARGQRIDDCQRLLRLGATNVVSEYLHASMELAGMALRDLGVGKSQRKILLDAFRRQYLNQLFTDKQDKPPG